MASHDRVSALREYVGQPSYVCSIGASMARQGRLPLFEMPEAVEGRAEVARDAIRELLMSGRGGAVGIIYPFEPESYEKLQALHADVHATVFATAVAESAIVANRQGNFRLPQAGKDVPRALLPLLADAVRRQYSQPFIAFEGTRIIQNMGVKVAADPYQSFEGIRDASAALLAIDPNIAPGVGNNALQAIVLSPQFTGDSSPEVSALLQQINLPDLPHGRYAPVTAMVLNYHADVMAALQSSTGRVIRERMNMALTFTRYKAMHVLAEKPDATKRHRNLLEALSGLDGKEA